MSKTIKEEFATPWGGSTPNAAQAAKWWQVATGIIEKATGLVLTTAVDIRSRSPKAQLTFHQMDGTDGMTIPVWLAGSLAKALLRAQDTKASDLLPSPQKAAQAVAPVTPKKGKRGPKTVNRVSVLQGDVLKHLKEMHAEGHEAVTSREIADRIMRIVGKPSRPSESHVIVTSVCSGLRLLVYKGLVVRSGERMNYRYAEARSYAAQRAASSPEAAKPDPASDPSVW